MAQTSIRALSIARERTCPAQEIPCAVFGFLFTKKILGVQCAHYQLKFGKLTISDTLEVLNSETMNDAQATWIADGFEMAVVVLKVLERARPKHWSLM